MALQDSSPGRRFLISAAFAPSTTTMYNDAVSSFLFWSEDQQFDPSSPSDFDDHLTDYIHHLFITNQGKGKAHATLYGILMYMPHLKQHLHFSAMALRGWGKVTPTKSYPPLSWELTCAVALRMALNGHLRAAIGTLLAFDCFLRVNELVGLHREDVADAKDARIGAFAVDMTIRLRQTKTGPNQWVTVEDPQVKSLLRLAVSCTSPGQRLFPFSAAVFRSSFKRACSDLSLSSSYVPHSLRHGGATRAHLLNRPMEDILVRGRWASSKSARRYIQSGRAMLMTMDVPVRLQSLSASVSKNISLFLSLSQSH
jgi:integrase-like protein